MAAYLGLYSDIYKLILTSSRTHVGHGVLMPGIKEDVSWRVCVWSWIVVLGKAAPGCHFDVLKDSCCIPRDSMMW